MKAAIYYGPENIRTTEVADAQLSNSHDVLVEVNATSICGSDLHLYRGALDGIMERGHSQTGHELIGTVREVGSAVAKLRVGDRISMGYSCSCGDCYMCKVGQTAHCETTQKAVYGFGTGFGDLNGTHAEALVLPHADAHAIKVPESIPDGAALTLSCNLPTAIIANQLADIQPGEKVALVGCGPTGLLCLDLISQRGAGLVVALDPLDYRLAIAARRGAETVNVAAEGWQEKALALADGRGFDKIIEVVGSPESLQTALDIVRPGGTIAAMGVFCDDTFNLVLIDVFLRDISLHMNGFANVQPFMWEGLRMLERGVIEPEQYFSHNFALDDIDQAFATFYEKRDDVLKVLIRP